MPALGELRVRTKGVGGSCFQLQRITGWAVALQREIAIVEMNLVRT